ncbi:INO80 complex subunit 1 [Choanephora cucurbitarum]|uniref:INO80 complex subunit 1 n=1 Tax=Choanephora cucurbitarum TaxID=101091 RepID=A0A1C7N8F1_9FUNG|nr:INO80 complex subunit 1 [Choanephora cucurbitarum]
MTDFEQPTLKHIRDEDHSVKSEVKLDVESEQDQVSSELLKSQQSPSNSKDNEQLICQWNNCLKVFSDHPSLASHLSEDHVGWKKGGYYCDWNNCARQGAKCHNRFALMMHLRIHTGEKPFECKVPDCGQTFGRMDALVRHKKMEHGEGMTMEKTAKASPLSPYPAKKPISTKRSALLENLPNKFKKPKYANIRRWPTSSLHTTTDWSSGDEMDEPQIKMSSRQPITPGSDYSQYRLAKAQLHYILRENEMLQDEYEMAQKKLKRMKTERKVLLEAAMNVEYNRKHQPEEEEEEDEDEDGEEEEIDVMAEENEDSMIPTDDI